MALFSIKDNRLSCGNCAWRKRIRSPPLPLPTALHRPSIASSDNPLVFRNICFMEEAYQITAFEPVRHSAAQDVAPHDLRPPFLQKLCFIDEAYQVTLITV
jgi:hypothetical protein